MNKLTSEQRELFNKLHNEKVQDSQVFKKRDYAGYFSSIIDKYPESAHFIYELLQNADDAEATEVHIILKYDRLIFKHNGRKHFDITSEDEERQGDINAITGIGFSNKKFDSKENAQNKIGKFGVGFKAVFQYTDTPEIYDDVFKFKIEDYIIPTLLEEDHLERNEGETLFVFPFKVDTRKQCFNDIANRLHSLENPILFLNNLEKIVWRIDNNNGNPGENFLFVKQLIESVEYENGILQQRYILKEPKGEKSIFLFSREINVETKKHKIYIGFFYDKTMQKLVTDDKTRPIYCFFPTKESFKTCFISHAPFLLTDNRQNLKPNQEVNAYLLRQLSLLAADAVICLRDYGMQRNHWLIDENIIDIIPQYDRHIWMSNLIEDTMVNAFSNLLKKEAILLSRGNVYLKIKEAYLSIDALYSLLSRNQFLLLRGFDKNSSADFLRGTLRIKIVDLRKKISTYNEIKEYSIENLASDITESFMSEQSIDWVTKFYTFLRDDARKFWNKTNPSKLTDLIFRNAPIIKIQSGRWVAPFVDFVSYNVFFPINSSKGNLNNSCDYNFIHSDYLQEEMAMKFFNALEIKEPKEYDYICKIILRRYDDYRPEESGLIEDFLVLVNYYCKIANDNLKLNEYKQILRERIRLLCTNRMYRIPETIYFNSDVLRYYYKVKRDVNFLDEDFYCEIKNQFGDKIYYEFFEIVLGVAKFPRIVSSNVITEDAIIHFKKQIQSSSYTYSLKKDYKLDSFFDVCSRNYINKDISIFIWNELLLQKDIEKYRKMVLSYKIKHARNFSDIVLESTLISELKKLRWILGKDDKLYSATQIYQEDLSLDYNLNNGMIQLLGIEKKQRDLTKIGATKAEQKIFELGLHFEQLLGGDLSEEEKKELQDKFKCFIESYKNDKRRKQILEKESLVSDDNTTKDNISLNESNKDSLVEEPIDEKLKKRWDEKKNRRVGKPHSLTQKGDEQLVDIVNTSKTTQTDDSPFFVEPMQVQCQNSIDDITKAQKNLKAKDTKAQEDAEIAKEQVDILGLLEATPIYTFKWFKLLMELMHAGRHKITERRIQIDFSNLDIICSEKILHLTRPSMPIPSWCSDAEKYSIIALLDDSTHIKIDGLIVKTDDDSIDVSIEMDNKLRQLCRDYKKIRIIATDNTNIIDSLETRFLQLDKDDEFDMNENLPTNIEFIYGPPGTGKTTELVKTVHRLLEKEPKAKILVLTPTNKAADVVAIKMANDDVCEGGLARYGATESLYLIEEIGCVTNRDTTDMKDWCNVVVATAARYAYDYLQPDDTAICDYNWDYIFIDEASMIDIITITYVIYKGASAKKIFISGDPIQIQPVAQNDMPTYNIYNMVNLRDFAKALNGYDRYPVRCLMIQHRSTPIIGKLISDFAYNGLLQSNPKRTQQKPLRLDGIKFSDINFLGFDVAELDDIKGLNSIGQSAFNLYSVIFTYNLIEYTIRQISKYYPNKDYSIGVVCAYRAQSDAIKNMLENRSLDTDYCKVTCGTVHSFQGDECDIMFIVLNPPAECTSGTHINNQNIINVAMSRARDYIFFVLPSGQTKGFAMKNVIGKMVSRDNKSVLFCKDIERVMFNGNDNFIYENTHVTCHMPINVYCEDTALYEVRMSDDSLDIKINN